MISDAETEDFVHEAFAIVEALQWIRIFPLVYLFGQNLYQFWRGGVHKNTEIFQNQDFSDADVIFCYLLPRYGKIRKNCLATIETGKPLLFLTLLKCQPIRFIKFRGTKCTHQLLFIKRLNKNCAKTTNEETKRKNQI